MGIRAALDRIKTVEEGLSITSPATVTPKRVYKMTPKASGALEVPCFIHSVALPVVEHTHGLRKQVYTVRSQFFCNDPDLDRAQDICAAMLEAWLDAFSADLTLNGNCAGPIRLRGLDPTITSLTWGNAAYPGLDLVIEVPFGPEAVTVGP